MLLDICVPGEDSTSESDISEKSDDEHIDSPYHNEESSDEAPVLSPPSDSSVSSEDDLNQLVRSVIPDKTREQSERESTSEHFSFIIVGDNLDHTVHPR